MVSRQLSTACYAQGGIDSGGHENPMTAAVRELKEETGISSARIVALARHSPPACAAYHPSAFVCLPAWPGLPDEHRTCP